MYETTLTIHSWIRWALVLCASLTLVRSVYALVREPGAMNRAYDSSIGVISAADLSDGVSFGDPGLTTSVGTAAVANGTLDLDSEYFLTNVTVTNSTDAVVIITKAVTYAVPNGTNEPRRELTAEPVIISANCTPRPDRLS